MRMFNSRRGGNAVEFALTLPLLTVIMALTVDYGWFFHYQFHVTNACNVAVQTAASVYADSQDAGTAGAIGQTAGDDAWTATGLDSRPIIVMQPQVAVPDLVFQASCEVAYEPLWGAQDLMRAVLGNRGSTIMPTKVSHVAVRRGANQMAGGTQN